tara:strand:- start:321 stop:425 length:105 start_codon:yes stop_codon:yes gene_type:complete
MDLDDVQILALRSSLQKIQKYVVASPDMLTKEMG